MSKQPFILRREGTKLVPADAWTAERLDGFPEGRDLKAATITIPRSLPFQGFYWVHLKKIVEATECAASHKHLHKSLLKLNGYVKPIHNKHGDVVDWAVDSTAFDEMSQEEFYEYVEKAKRSLAEYLEIIWDDFSRKVA